MIHETKFTNYKTLLIFCSIIYFLQLEIYANSYDSTAKYKISVVDSFDKVGADFYINIITYVLNNTPSLRNIRSSRHFKFG